MLERFKATFFKKGKKIDESSLKGAFKKVKEEFDEHLDTINQNTNEIQANYEYVCELDSKIDKLTQRLDEMQMFLSRQKVVDDYKLAMPVKKLTYREQEVFMVLYTSSKEDITYASIAKRLGFNEEMVKNYVSALGAKGVPIIKKLLGDKIFISLEEGFKNYQTKENILEIHENLAKQFV